MVRSLSIATLLGLALFADAVLAQTPPAGTPPTPPPPQAPGPPLALSLEAAQTAMATCAANGYKVAVVVVDSAGAVRVALAADGVNPRAVDFVQRKVNTVIKYGEPSAAAQEKVKTDTALAATISADPKLVARAGALPIKSKAGVIIGAIGVGGAPGGDKDDVCSLAGIDKIKDRL